MREIDVDRHDLDQPPCRPRNAALAAQATPALTRHAPLLGRRHAVALDALRRENGGGGQSTYFSSACQVHFSPLTFHALPLMCVPEIRPCRSLNL